MKILKSISIAAFIFCSAAAAGQNPKEIIANASAKISSYDCVEFAFDFEAIKASGEVIGTQSGIFISQGEMFVVTAPEINIYCDGTSKWIYDKDSQEITIIAHNPQQSDITENPFSVFKSAETVYDFQGKASKNEAGDCWVIKMKPKDKKINYSSVELSIRCSDYTPVTIKYLTKGGDVYFATVNSFVPVEKKDDSFFLVDIDSLVDVIVTDLR